MRLNWSNIGKGLTDVADAKKYVDRRRDLDKLGKDYRTVEGRGLRVTNRETGESSTVVIDPNSGADMDTIRNQYMDAGYMVDTVDKAYTARSGEGRDLGNYGSEIDADSAGRRANYGLNNRRADIYEHYGDLDMARGLRREVRNDQRQDVADARAAESHGLEMRIRGVQAKKAEGDFAKEEELDFDIAAAQGLGTPEERAAALIQAYTKYDPKQAAELQKMYTSQQIDEIALTAAKINESKMLAQRQGVKGMVQWYNEIPDGMRVELIPSKKADGLYTVMMYDEGNPKAPARAWAEDMTESEIMEKIDAHTTPGGTMKLAAHVADLRVKDAHAAAYRASAAESHADADLKNRTDPNVRGGVSASDKVLGRLQAQQTYLGKQLADAREEARTYRPGSPEHKAAVERVNLIGADLKQVEAQIGSALGFGGGDQSGKPQLDDAKRAAILNRSVELLKSGQATPEEINAELSALGMGTIENYLSPNEMKGGGLKRREPEQPRNRDEWRAYEKSLYDDQPKGGAEKKAAYDAAVKRYNSIRDQINAAQKAGKQPTKEQVGAIGKAAEEMEMARQAYQGKR